MNNMRIVIDMQGAQTESRFRGIGRYTIAFAKAVVRNRGNHEVFLALSGLHPDTIESIRSEFDGLLDQQKICIWSTPFQIPNGNEVGDHRETAELLREAFLTSLNPDIVHISSLFEGYDAITSIGKFDSSIPVSVILYDLIPLLNPSQYLKPNPQYERYYLQKIEYLRRSTLKFAISDFSKQEGMDALGVSEEEIVAISTAADPHFKPQAIDEKTASHLKRKFGISHPFLLYTGGTDDRKNLNRLIEAYSCLSYDIRQNFQLVFAGKISEFELLRLKTHAYDLGLKSEEICFTAYVSDTELILLYNLCQAFVFPSWHEGFGLPALEAMSCGAPVIGANNTSLPEVIGLKEALFDPFDIKDISAKITLVLTDENYRANIRKHGLIQAKKFNWDVVANRAIKAWEMLPSKLISEESVKKVIDNRDFLYEKIIKYLALTNSKSTDYDLIDIARCLALNEIERDLIFTSF